jgi:hypothetical protein
MERGSEFLDGHYASKHTIIFLAGIALAVSSECMINGYDKLLEAFPSKPASSCKTENPDSQPGHSSMPKMEVSHFRKRHAKPS